LPKQNALDGAYTNWLANNGGYQYVNKENGHVV
jgi:hypothetical protein